MESALPFPVTALYAGLLGLLFVILAARIPRLRYKAKAGIGDGGDPTLARAVRVHGNFAEHVPIALVIMAIAEANGLGMWTHLLGAPLLIGRIAHAQALGRSTGPSALRAVGMATAWGVIAIGGAICIAQSLRLI